MRAIRSATEAGKWKLFDREVDFIRANQASKKKTKELVLTENADLYGVVPKHAGVRAGRSTVGVLCATIEVLAAC